MSLKFRCQARHPLSEKYSQIYTLNTVDGKEAGKEDFTTKMIAPRGVNKTDKTPQGSPEFAHESPFFINFFFFLHFLAVGAHCTASTVRKHLTK